MTPLRYEVVGEEDYAFTINVDKEAVFHVSGGTYASESPRSGKLSSEQQEELLSAIIELGIPEEHPSPEDAANAFNATLMIGEGENAVTYPFWEGALEDDPKLLKLVRLLEMV